MSLRGWQEWRCDACNASGRVRMHSEEEAGAVVERARDDHRVRSADCGFTVAAVQMYGYPLYDAPNDPEFNA